MTDSPELGDLVIVLLCDLGEIAFPLRIYTSSSEKQGAGLDDPLHLLLYAADGEWIAWHNRDSEAAFILEVGEEEGETDLSVKPQVLQWQSP